MYNVNGNIESVKTYAYTPEGTALSGTPINTETFTYDADKLTAYNGSSLTYNANGGVSSYDGWDYTWSKGKLSTIRKILSGTSRALIAPVLMPSKTYSYTYNGYGQRIGKSYSYIVGAPGMTDVYKGMPIGYDKKFHYDQSGRLIAENSVNRYYNEMDETDHIVYLYDESGIIGMEYTATSGATNTYYFQRNIQGDVVAIYNTNGKKVGGYDYDAWGNCSITLDTNGIASRNPIRYRGYYFDSETGFYYLNSRYYSPEWRRFISPDDTAYLDPENVNGLNLYCYCGNDPINYADPSGHEPEWWQWALFGVGVALVAIAAGMAFFGTGGIAAFGMGALIGSAAIGGAGAVIGGAVGYATGGVDGIIGGAMAGFGIGAIVGFAVGGSIGLGVWNHDVKLARQFLTNNNVNEAYHNEIINAFKYRIKIKSINVDTTVYRYYPDAAKRISYWVTPRTYSNPIQKLALAYGNNTAKYLAQLTLKSGAQVLAGTVAGAGGLLGGGIQYYVYDLSWILG